MTDQQKHPSQIEESREDLLRESDRIREESARESAQDRDAPSKSLLVFSIGNEWYAVDLAHVKRVLRTALFAHVPGAPPEVKGLMNSQGEVLCVLDLRKILGIPPAPKGDATADGFVVVLHFGEKDAGILVDGVDDAWEIPVSEVLPPLESLEPSRARFYEGTVSRGGRFVGLLSAGMCLNP